MRCVLVFLSLLVAGAASASDGMSTFEVNGRGYGVPVADGFCDVTDSEAVGRALARPSTAGIRRFIDVKVLQVDCDAAGRLDDPAILDDLRLRIWGVVAREGQPYVATGQNLLQFEMMRSLFASLQTPGKGEVRNALVERMLAGAAGKGLRPLCAVTDANEAAVGGKLCLEFPGNQLIRSGDFAGSVRIVNGRFLTAVSLLLPSGDGDWPGFEDAEAMLNQVRGLE